MPSFYDKNIVLVKKQKSTKIYKNSDTNAIDNDFLG
jgi:hypothetical protein